MLSNGFRDFCELIWQSWISNELSLSTAISDRFQVDYLPEPYLVFGDPKDPLYFLTTNPGEGFCLQCRSSICSGSDGLSELDSYAQLATKLPHCYKRILPRNSTARKRIHSFLDLAKTCGHDGVIQIESIPFHSKSLPGKQKLVNIIKTDDFLSEYATFVHETLRNQSVIALSAIGPQGSITQSSIHQNLWLKWQSELIGYQASKTDLLELTTRNGRVTSAFIYSKTTGGFTKGFILMMGGNNMPGRSRYERIADVFQRKQNA